MRQTGINVIQAFLKAPATITAALLALLLCSCSEDVITVDLNTAEPHIVIEGVVTDDPGPYTVSVSKTTDFFRPGGYSPVSGATVVISDDAGAMETLTETEPGLYLTSGLQGTPGSTYTLRVSAEGKEYSAQSTMHTPTSIDSLFFEIESDGDEEYLVHFYFQDTENLKEYYRLKIFINGEYYDYFTYQDRLTDGNDIDGELYIHDEELYDDDVITVEMHTIDRPVYEYFSTLRIAIAGGADGMMAAFSGTPANPTSNIDNGALGYFGAMTIRPISLTIKK